MATNSIDIQNNGFQSLKALVTAVISLTHDTSFQYASAVVEEDARLRKQIDSQNAEVTRLIGREKELEAIKETTYREMFDVNEKEKLKNAEARKEIERLTAKIQENEQKIAECVNGPVLCPMDFGSLKESEEFRENLNDTNKAKRIITRI